MTSPLSSEAHGAEVAALAARLLACRTDLARVLGEPVHRLLAPERAADVAARWLDWRARRPERHPPPHFEAEITPSPAAIVAALPVLPHGAGALAAVPTGELASALARAGWVPLLALAGVRTTPASVVNGTAVPPDDVDLLAAADRPVGADGLSAAARALAKHAARAVVGGFWGVEAGGVAARNARARGIVARILASRTWWNAFGHYRHEVVVEAREPGGHGVRWSRGGAELVGFLDPFDPPGSNPPPQSELGPGSSS